MQLPPYVVLDKAVGETPLSCAEAWRNEAGVAASVPLAYAGRLDPMASGKLLVLIGDECKNQINYHGLDKAYDFSVLIGIGSDTHDVLGRLKADYDRLAEPSSNCGLRPAIGVMQFDDAPSDSLVTKGPAQIKMHSPNPRAKRAFLSAPALEEHLRKIAVDLKGDIELPYPHFSAKTVQGKPLHMWTLEDRLDEIEIPRKESTIYSLELIKLETKTRQQVCTEARAKIDTIPPVTDECKALGNDFRRAEVRADWERIKQDTSLPEEYTIAHFYCIASSGTYMRTLAHLIGQKLDTAALAWHIHRTDIGTYDPATQAWAKSL